MLAWPKGLIGFTKCFCFFDISSSVHSVADAGGVISARLSPSSDLLASSSPMLVFLALPKQPRMALTKC